MTNTKLAEIPNHDFNRPERVDGGYRDRKCEECGLRDDSSVHDYRPSRIAAALAAPEPFENPLEAFGI